MMKSTVFQAALCLSSCLVWSPLPAAAADAPNAPSTKGKPAAKARRTHSLFEYQKELGLTDDQITRMKAAVQSLQEKLVDLAKSEDQAGSEVHELVLSNADMKLIRAKLHVVADIEVERQASDIETSRAISQVMTPDQQEKWRAIQVRLSRP